MAGNQGLSANSGMDDKTRDRIHKEGGKASHATSGGGSKSDSVITNKSGGGRLTKDDLRKGGQSSHNN